MPRWLNDEEQALWRQWLRVTQDLDAALARQLLADEGMSLSDFVVLVHLTEAPEGKLRSSELAERLHWERSRLSHHVGRMESRGLVRRDEVAEDRRGARVCVTEVGRRAIEAAAPSHVEAVRARMIDALDERDRADLVRVLGKVAQALQAPVPAPQDRLG